ncbi:MAG TPA: MotA/TolQ/ExbB proton channel family protein [Candidatus Sulfotelmatobacter sp.]|nr:MotA/TolQ/ExbB proton channel family protein [Candidatus Sulfotelmatobacter sp.]
MTLLYACATVAEEGFINFFLGDVISGLALILFASPFALLEQTGWVARVVLGILLVLSLFSWAIIFQKSRLFGQIEPQTKRFLQMFRAGRGLPDPNTLRVGAGGTPLVVVYQAGYRELEAQLGGAGSRPGAPATPTKVRNAHAVGVEMQVAAGEEVRRLEKWMPWLATTGSVSPFIGLFGTVWGVMDAFSGLGDAGSASLRAVAPGIAEALITTAAGLFAAIPAVIAYNYYLGGIRALANRMDSFASEFVAKIETLYSA